MPVRARLLLVTARRVLTAMKSTSADCGWRSIADEGRAHRLVTAGIDEVGAEHAVAVAEKHVGAVPLVHAEVGVEAVRQGVPRHLPAHLRLNARDVRLWRA